MLFATIFGILLGVLAAIKKGTWLDTSALFASIAGISAPSFFMAIIIAFSGMFAFAWTASVMISMTKNFRQAYTRLHMQKLKLPAEVIERFK
jgi:ABC-type dipeptide/oligopeptide/nickel transport system permease component